MPDFSRKKLGKGLPVLDPKRRLKLVKYLLPILPPPPPSCDWTGGVTSFGEMLNDNLGDCTIAGIGHAIQTLSQSALGHMTTDSDAIIQMYYEKWCGYNPADPNTDQGGVEPDILNRFRQEGFNGTLLLAYADPSPGDIAHIEQSIALFGGVYIGLQLPNSAQSQSVWEYVKYDGGNWGGHCVWVPKYDHNAQLLTCITWGVPQNMTYEFWSHYCDEAHTLFIDTWLDAKGTSPSQYDRAQLLQDQQLVIN